MWHYIFEHFKDFLVWLSVALKDLKSISYEGKCKYCGTNLYLSSQKISRFENYGCRDGMCYSCWFEHSEEILREEWFEANGDWLDHYNEMRPAFYKEV